MQMAYKYIHVTYEKTWMQYKWTLTKHHWMRVTANENESSLKVFAQKHSSQTNSIFYLSNVFHKIFQGYNCRENTKKIGTKYKQ